MVEPQFLQTLQVNNVLRKVLELVPSNVQEFQLGERSYRPVKEGGMLGGLGRGKGQDSKLTGQRFELKNKK